MARHGAGSVSEISQTSEVHDNGSPVSHNIHNDNMVSQWTSLLSDNFASPSLLAKQVESQYETRNHHVPLPYAKKPRGSRFVSGTQFRDSSVKVESPPVTEDFTPQIQVRKATGSRFVSTSYTKDSSLRYENVEEIPPPYHDERVLASIVSAKLELATLKKNHAKDELTIQRLEDRIAREDRRESPKHHRRDSAMGSTDGGSERGAEVGSSERKLLVEKNRLETAVRELQREVDRSSQAAIRAETSLNKVAKDRDCAYAQLRHAQFAIEQLRADNQSLEEINSMLKNCLDGILEVQNTTILLPDEPQQRLNQDPLRAQPPCELDEQDLEKPKLTQLELDQQSRKLVQQRLDQIELNKQKESDHCDLDQRNLHQKRREQKRPDPLGLGRQKGLEEQQQKREKVQKSVSQLDAEKKWTPTETNAESPMSDDGITYVSIPSDREIGDLRDTLEQERRERRSRQGAPAPDVTTERDISSSGPSEPFVSLEDDFSRHWAGDTHPEFVEEPLPTSKGHTRDDKKTLSTIANIRTTAEDKPIHIPSDDEPTIRPSQPLAVALASVIKGLEDELSISKRELAQYQALYNNQNPSLAKRARKSLKQKMDDLLPKIDRKADYIYSLYDVVEAQKQKSKAGQDSEVGEDNIRQTLRDLGMDNLWV